MDTGLRILVCVTHAPYIQTSRTYCDDYLPHYQREQYARAFHGSGLVAIQQKKREGADPTHGAEARRRRAKSNVRRKTEAREWDERYGKLTDLSAFEHEILPGIQSLPLSQLVDATGLSLRYVSLIRRGGADPSSTPLASVRRRRCKPQSGRVRSRAIT